MAEDNSYKLLAILQSHAPDSKAQEACTKFYNELKRENRENSKEIELQLVGALFDGLSYGNWFWRI